MSNPWVIGREEEIEELNAIVDEAVNERNKCMAAVNARRRLRTRVSVNARRGGEVWMMVLEVRLESAKTRVR